jgi:glycosyltransferase involved in cell wall biosynthesis
MAGPLFRELAEDLARDKSPCLLYTGHQDTLQAAIDGDNLHILPGPAYNRKNLFGRAVSWISYFIHSLIVTWFAPRQALLFIVSNPPFLGLLGAFFKMIRNQSYVVLVYDIYPDLLINLGRIQNRILVKCWQSLNRFVYNRADLLFTIGQDMALRLEGGMASANQKYNGKVIWVWPWADVKKVCPIPKQDNWFARAHGMVGQTIILYSGNMGHTHDIEAVVRAAERLSSCKDIFFVFIGEGVKYTWLEGLKDKGKMENVMLLPFQPEAVLPLSMASADMGIAAYEKGTEGCMLPSKTFYYMAAGVVPIIISYSETDLTEMVTASGCGIWIKHGDDRSLAEAILSLHHDRKRLNDMKMKARRTAEQDYSRKNTAQFKKALARYLG